MVPPSIWASFEATLDPNDGHVKQLQALVACREAFAARGAACRLLQVSHFTAVVHS